MHEFHLRARERKLTFLSVTDTYVHCENRSLIQSLALMHSAITKRTIYSTAEAFEGENFHEFQDFVANHLYTVHAYLPLFQCAIKRQNDQLMKESPFMFKHHDKISSPPSPHRSLGAPCYLSTTVPVRVVYI